MITNLKYSLKGVFDVKLLLLLFISIASMEISFGQTDLVRWSLTSNGDVTYTDSSVSANPLTTAQNILNYSNLGVLTTGWGNPSLVHYRFVSISISSSNGNPVDVGNLMFEHEAITNPPTNYTIRYYIAPNNGAIDDYQFYTNQSSVLINNESISANPIKNIPLNMTISGTQRLIIRFYTSANDYNNAGWRIKANTLKITAPANSPTDLAIDKTVDEDEPDVNDDVTFTIMVTNNGPDDATGVVVTDQLPNGYAYVSHSTLTGSYNQGTGIWSIGNLADGNTVTLTITATVLGSGTHNNTASVTANESDSIPANNSDTVIVTPNIPTADLKITKTVDDEEPSISENVTFTLTVTNDGPDDATGVVVTDQLPNGYAYVSHSTLTGSYNQGTGIWTIGNLTNGNSATLTITATVLGSGNHTNTAIVTANEYDPTADNNTDSETPLVGYGTTDLEIEKFASHHQEINQYTFFTIIVRNNGSAAATNVLVEDNLNSSWNFSAQNYQASHGTVTTTGTQNRNIDWEIPYIPSGGVAILLFRAQNNYNDWESWPQGRDNTATITAMDQTDSNMSNNSNTVTSIVHYPAHVHELAVTKSVSPEEPYIGQGVEFTIEVEKTGTSNSGPDYLELLDKLPPGYTYMSSSATSGSYNPTTGIWTVGTPWDWTGTEILTITAMVNSPTGQPDEYKNIVAISSPGPFPDTVLNNNMDSVTIPTPIADPNGTDLQLTKTVDDDEPMVMNDVVFTITVLNDGPNLATGVTVTDLLPSGYEYVSSNPSVGTYNSNTGIWSVGNLAVSATATLEITATVLVSGDYENMASISANQTDNIPSNNTHSITVTPDLSNTVDLEITKIVDNETPEILEEVVFTIEVENIGINDATGVIVTDVIPSGYDYINSTGGATYNSGTKTVTWNVGDLNASAIESFSITAIVKAGGNHNNIAFLVSDQPDINPENNTDSAIVTPNPSSAVDLGVLQSVDNETPNVGNSVTFTIIASNNGPVDATGVTVNTILANGLQYISHTAPSLGSYNAALGVWTIGSLDASETAVLTITAQVLSDPGAAYLSIAEITGSEIDFDNNIINNISYSILSPNGQQFLGCDVNAENPVFSEDFGSGVAPYASELIAGRTNLIYQQGENLFDGEYTVAKNAQLGYDNWQNITDPSGDPNGYFMIINADLEPHEFFRIRITLSEEFCANTRYNVNFKVINVNSQVNYDHCTNNEGGLILPEIGYFVQNNSGEVLGAGTSGEIPYNAIAEWIEKEFIFISGVDDEWVELVLFNKAPGGCGNDLAIDDITIYACMTPPIKLDMQIDTDELEVCGGETVIMQVVYATDENYQWPPEAWVQDPEDLDVVEYQWQRSEDQLNWVDLPGEITDTYVIEDFQESDQAYYRLLYAQKGNIDKISCRFPSDELFPVFNATPVLGEIESEVEEEELCVGAGPFQLINDYEFSDDYDDWDEEYHYFLWESLTPSVATIDQDGMLTAISPGTVTIAYTVHSPKAVCTGYTQRTFIIRTEDCNVPPQSQLITNPMIHSRMKSN